MTTDSTRLTCPSCDQKGRKLGAETANALLRPEAKARLGDAKLRFCRNEACELVYFAEREELTFGTDDLSVPVFQKSTEPERFVCYCFEHSVRSLQDEVAATGESGVPASIGEKCKAGLDECEVKNPQGSCCLGNVRKVVKDAIAADGGTPDSRPAEPDCCGGDEPSAETAPEAGCCSPEKPADSSGPSGSAVSPLAGDAGAPRTESKAGLVSSAGAVLGAVLASACCWLPLLLIGMGASTVGVAGFFEAYRPVFLGATVLLLGAGFYYVYIRKPKCAPGEACEVPNPKLQRLNKISLWLATFMVVVFATFPNYIGVLFGDDGSGTAAAAAQAPATVSRTYAIEGMTCEGCAGHVRTAVSGLPGVQAVEVSYAEGSATVVFGSAEVDDAAVLAAVATTGYSARAPAEGASPGSR